jgi:hypothetical protein
MRLLKRWRFSVLSSFSHSQHVPVHAVHHKTGNRIAVCLAHHHFGAIFDVQEPLSPTIGRIEAKLYAFHHLIELNIGRLDVFFHYCHSDIFFELVVLNGPKFFYGTLGNTLKC